MARFVFVTPSQTRYSRICRRNTSKQSTSVLLASRYTFDCYRASPRPLGPNLLTQRIKKVLPLFKVHPPTLATHRLHGALPRSFILLSTHSFPCKPLHKSNPRRGIPTNDPSHLPGRLAPICRKVWRGRDAQ